MFGTEAKLANSIIDLANIFEKSGWFGKIKFEEALSQLNSSISKFQGKAGFDDSVLKNLKNKNTAVQDGLKSTWFSLKEMESISPSNVKNVDLSFEVDDLGNSLPCDGKNGRCFDVELVSGPPRFIEFKSIKEYLVKDKISFNVGQLKAYLENIENLDDLSYVFNSSKLVNPKEFMRKVFLENAEQLFKSGDLNGIFNNITLETGMKLNITTWEQLENLCNSPSFEKSTLFNFVR